MAAETGAFWNRAAGRQALRRYTVGLICGVVLSIVILATVYAVVAVGIRAFIVNSALTGPGLLSLRDAIVCIGGGAAGAVVSVMLRLRPERGLNYEASAVRAAILRIAMGWFFAAVLLFLIKGGIVNMFSDPSAALIDPSTSSPTGGSLAFVKSWFFWGGLGFIAGFNERWVRDMVATETRVDRRRREDAAQSDVAER